MKQLATSTSFAALAVVALLGACETPGEAPGTDTGAAATVDSGGVGGSDGTGALSDALADSGTSGLDAIADSVADTSGPADTAKPQPCGGPCPTGEVCAAPKGGTVADTLMCRPLVELVCIECETDLDCPALTGRCVGGEESGFCGLGCDTAADCPPASECALVTTTGGDSAMQCVPKSGGCDCTSVQDGDTRPCAAQNGYGSCVGTETCHAETGWTACDAVTPAAELCNGEDDDCDGQTDEDFGQLGAICDGPDEDLCALGEWTCTESGGIECVGDETKAELCDGKDNDCDGKTDEDFPDKGVPCDTDDADSCAYGLWFCTQDGSGLSCEGDVNVVEVCNGSDDDCDGLTDEGFADLDADGAADCVDKDKDGDGVANDADCAPMDPAVFPGAEEACNGVDDDCDEQVDEGFKDTDGNGEADCVDGDIDDDKVLNGDDNCVLVPNTDQTDTDEDGKGDACDNDDDNDGVVDEEDNCPLLATADMTDTDQDGLGDPCDDDDDGDGDPDVTDCKPKTAAIHHQAEETCNGVDDNCNSLIDEGFADNDKDSSADCVDKDDDNDGDPDTTDCAPFDKDIRHGAVETCNLIDDDCDGAVDEGFPDKDGDGEADCADLDDDGDGDPDLTDCKPNDPAIHHDAEETCDGVDNNCNDKVDEGFADNEKDGLADCVDKDDDNDGVADVDDNCPFVDNTLQEDLDGDELGDACDSDIDGDGASNEDDCKPKNAAIHGGATELCNGLDDDCDDLVDEEDAAGCATWFYDADNDGYGIASNQKCLCTAKDKYSTKKKGDCNDGNVSVFPGASESCNAVDDDCDGTVDEPSSLGCTPYYEDVDKDGWGHGDPACLCGPEGAMTANKPGDCDDGDASVNKSSPELCNGKDDDCDGEVDEAGAAGCAVLYVDGDKDGFGKPGTGVCLCGPKDGHTVAQAGDCDDTSATTHTGATEKCNGKDDDCDGAVDEPGATGCTTYYKDGDGDGYGLVSSAKCLCAEEGEYVATKSGDCNDLAVTVNPGATETCNGADDDCNGFVDETNAAGCTVYLIDGDGDGFGLNGTGLCMCAPKGKRTTTVGDECDDTNENIYPGADEVCNQHDDDCDGQVDEEAAGKCAAFYFDGDGDQYGIEEGSKCLCGAEGKWSAIKKGDCDDTNAAVHPLAEETCNGVDDNCKAGVDEQDATGCLVYFRDFDKDGYGLQTDSACLCAPTGLYTASGIGDCDDTASSVHDGAAEVCNGVDDDCDSMTDEENALTCTVYYRDNDLDGFGQTNDERCLCAKEAPYTTTVNGDCDDSMFAIKPSAKEKCDAVDNDCDGQTDEQGAQGCAWYFLDKDDDQYGVPGDNKCLCAATGDYTATQAGDCNDDLAAVNTGATESCNGIDDNCNDKTDEVGADGCTDYFEDFDKDGFGKAAVKQCACGPAGLFTAAAGTDCNDNNAAISPAVTEICNNIDDDCDGIKDEPDATGCTKLYKDVDGDTYGIADFQCLCAAKTPYTALVSGDCDDDVITVHPDAAESCNGVDDDCDLATDEGEGNAGCSQWYKDMDEDDYGLDATATCLCGATGDFTATEGGDCDDDVPEVHPNAPEVCNTIDDNCELGIDEGFPNLGLICDGGDDDQCSNGLEVCSPDGLSTLCDEALGVGIVEVCDGQDNNCDGDVDEGYDVDDACVLSDLPGDADLCSEVGVKVCDADHQGTHCELVTLSEKTELCGNEIDDDCDGETNEDDAVGCTEYFHDQDQDTYGLTEDTQCKCAGSAPYTATQGGDCDDDVPEVKPGATELCNGIDDNCIDGADEGFNVGGMCDGGDPDDCKTGHVACDPADDTLTKCLEDVPCAVGAACVPDGDSEKCTCGPDVCNAPLGNQCKAGTCMCGEAPPCNGTTEVCQDPGGGFACVTKP